MVFDLEVQTDQILPSFQILLHVMRCSEDNIVQCSWSIINESVDQRSD